MQLSVLDLAPVGSRLDARRRPRRLVAPRPGGRTARLPALLGRRAPQHAGHRQLVAAGADRPPRRRHHDDPARAPAGVMLPNHSPLVVAEQFGMLEALHPGRIDLGLGRAPGTDQVTARSPCAAAAAATRGDDFPRELAELLAYFNDGSPSDHPFARDPRHARPRLPAGALAARHQRLQRDAGRPARAALLLRPPLRRRQHRGRRRTPTAGASARRRVLEAPYVMLGVNVCLRRADEEADVPGRLRRAGHPPPAPGPAPTSTRRPEEAAAYDYTPMEREVGARLDGQPRRRRPGDGAGRADELVARTGADELMLTTMAHARRPDPLLRAGRRGDVQRQVARPADRP